MTIARDYSSSQKKLFWKYGADPLFCLASGEKKLELEQTKIDSVILTKKFLMAACILPVAGL